MVMVDIYGLQHTSILQEVVLSGLSGTTEEVLLCNVFCRYNTQMNQKDCIMIQQNKKYIVIVQLNLVLQANEGMPYVMVRCLHA